MWRFAAALILSAVLHVAVMEACCRIARSARRPVHAPPRMDVSSVELSFAEQADDSRVDTSDVAAACEVPTPVEPSPPPAAFMPPVPAGVEAPEPPAGLVEVGEMSIPPAPEASMQADEAQASADTAARETAMVDAQPSPNAAFRPAYPRASRRRGEEGTVSLDVVVGADGVVASVAVAVSSGFQALDKAAMDAVRTARFEPATRSGRPVQGRVRLPVIFRLTR